MMRDVDEVSAATYGLFGREDALRALVEVLTEGGSAVVTADAGAGKSSLLRIADQVAQRGGRRVLSVTPTEFDRGLPFAGLAELVAQCPDGLAAALPEPQQRALAVALQQAAPDGREVDPLAVPLAVRGLLIRMCAAEPVVLILDDLQWLDQASAGSVGFALRRIPVEAERLCVLVGTRPVPGGGRELLRDLPEPTRGLSLPPLEDWAIGQLLRHHLGLVWTRPMTAGVARASGGNPFLALMVAQAMQSELSKWRWSARDGHDPVFPVPPSLVEILGEKVSLLPRSTRAVLLFVSAAGRLTVDQLADITDETQVREALDAAADWDVASVGAGAVVGFTHPMLASAIYETATPAERRRAHRVLAEMLEDPVERARHRARTITAPDAAVASELEHAAEISRGRGAQALAGELFEGAALATPIGSDAATGFGRWLCAVETHIGAGDTQAAEDALDRAAALATEPEQQAHVLIQRFNLTEDVSAARGFAEAALELTPAHHETHPQLLHMLGAVHRLQGDGGRALQLSRMAVEEATSMNLVDVQLLSLTERLSTERHWGVGDPQETLRSVEQLAERLQLDPRSAHMARTRSFFAAWDDPDAETHARSGIAHATDTGRYGDLSALYTSLVLVLIRASKVRAAQAALEEADRSAAWAGSSYPQDIARILVTEYAGDLSEARSVAHRAMSRPEIHGSTYWRGGFLAQLGFIEASARDWHAALEPLRELADIFTRTGMVDLEQLLWGVDYADAALQLGELSDVEQAISILRRQGASGRPEANVAANRCQALLTAAKGDVDSALNELVRVVDQRGDEAPFEAARSRLALGLVYRRAGYKGLATEALGTTADDFDSLGTPRWAERARDEARRVGLHPTNGRLTETERRVAELVGAGHSNQETASELFISVKTVEANLTRIYRKLAVRSRTELANRLNHPESGSPIEE